MPASAYPTKATCPRALEYEQPSEYPITTSPRFADGGQDFNLDADVKVRRWVLDHVNITETEAATLDAHVESARYNDGAGSAYAFDFTDRDLVTHVNCRYASNGYERPAHNKKHLQTRRVRLIKFP